MLNKLVPVVGNVCESNLGLEEDFADKIANEVDIIVNSAANTTFDERLWPPSISTKIILSNTTICFQDIYIYIYIPLLHCDAVEMQV